MAAEAVLITVFVIVGNTVLRPLAGAIDRIPLNTKSTEAEYEIRVSTTPEAAAGVRKATIARLAAAQFPVADADTETVGEGRVDIVATLVNTAVDRAKLEKVVAEIGAVAGVESASWETSSSS
jgi:putative Mg2+ transporter-C (MgtC) family protein